MKTFMSAGIIHKAGLNEWVEAVAATAAGVVAHK